MLLLGYFILSDFALDVFRLEKSSTIFVSTPVKPTGFFMLKFVDFLLKSAFFNAFSQKPYICSVFYIFPSDCKKNREKEKASF